MTPLQFYLVLGAAQIALLTGAHWTGRLSAAKNCEKRIAASAAQAIDEKNADDEAQGGAASDSDARLRAEIARLTRRLETTYVPTGLDCDEPGSGDIVRNAHDALFEAGLPAGTGGDGG